MIHVTIRTLESENYYFDLEDDITVHQFKEKISGKLNLPVENQRLIFKGKVLQDDLILNTYNVHDQVIHLVERPPPSSYYQPSISSSNASQAANSHIGASNNSAYYYTNAGNAFSNNNHRVYLGTVDIPFGSNFDPRNIENALSHFAQNIGNPNTFQQPFNINGTTTSTSSHASNNIETFGRPIPRQSPQSFSKARLELAQKMFKSVKRDLNKLSSLDVINKHENGIEIHRETNQNNGNDTIVKEEKPSTSRDIYDDNDKKNEKTLDLNTVKEENTDKPKDFISADTKISLETNSTNQASPAFTEQITFQEIPQANNISAENAGEDMEISTVADNDNSNNILERTFENRPKTHTLADMLSEYSNLLETLAPHLRTVTADLRRTDNIISEDEKRMIQSRFNTVSRIMHSLSHAQHALSDIVVNFGEPGDARYLRAAILHQAIVPVEITLPYHFGPMAAPSTINNQPLRSDAPINSTIVTQAQSESHVMNITEPPYVTSNNDMEMDSNNINTVENNNNNNTYEIRLEITQEPIELNPTLNDANHMEHSNDNPSYEQQTRATSHNNMAWTNSVVDTVRDVFSGMFGGRGTSLHTPQNDNGNNNRRAYSLGRRPVVMISSQFNPTSQASTNAGATSTNNSTISSNDNPIATNTNANLVNNGNDNGLRQRTHSVPPRRSFWFRQEGPNNSNTANRTPRTMTFARPRRTILFPQRLSNVDPRTGWGPSSAPRGFSGAAFNPNDAFTNTTSNLFPPGRQDSLLPCLSHHFMIHPGDNGAEDSYVIPSLNPTISAGSNAGPPPPPPPVVSIAYDERPINPLVENIPNTTIPQTSGIHPNSMDFMGPLFQQMTSTFEDLNNTLDSMQGGPTGIQNIPPFFQNLPPFSSNDINATMDSSTLGGPSVGNENINNNNLQTILGNLMSSVMNMYPNSDAYQVVISGNIPLSSENVNSNNPSTIPTTQPTPSTIRTNINEDNNNLLTNSSAAPTTNTTRETDSTRAAHVLEQQEEVPLTDTENDQNDMDMVQMFSESLAIPSLSNMPLMLLLATFLPYYGAFAETTMSEETETLSRLTKFFLSHTDLQTFLSAYRKRPRGIRHINRLLRLFFYQEVGIISTPPPPSTTTANDSYNPTYITDISELEQYMGFENVNEKQEFNKDLIRELLGKIRQEIRSTSDEIFKGITTNEPRLNLSKTVLKVIQTFLMALIVALVIKPININDNERDSHRLMQQSYERRVDTFDSIGLIRTAGRILYQLLRTVLTHPETDLPIIYRRIYNAANLSVSSNNQNIVDFEQSTWDFVMQQLADFTPDLNTIMNMDRSFLTYFFEYDEVTETLYPEEPPAKTYPRVQKNASYEVTTVANDNIVNMKANLNLPINNSTCMDTSNIGDWQSQIPDQEWIDIMKNDIRTFQSNTPQNTQLSQSINEQFRDSLPSTSQNQNDNQHNFANFKLSTPLFYSDAYMSGMSVKRRKVLEEQQNTFLASPHLDEYLRELLLRSLADSGIEFSMDDIETILENMMKDPELTTSFKAILAEKIKEAINDRKQDFDEKKYPDIQKFLDEN